MKILQDERIIDGVPESFAAGLPGGVEHTVRPLKAADPHFIRIGETFSSVHPMSHQLACEDDPGRRHWLCGA